MLSPAAEVFAESVAGRSVGGAIRPPETTAPAPV